MSTTAATTVTSLDGFHATPTAQRADKLARAFFDAVNADDPARTDAVLARSFLSYDVRGTRSRTGLRRYHSDLRQSFPDLRFQVHENIGVLVEGDNRVASRSVWDGTLTGGGQPVDFTTLDFFRIQDGLIAEHWESVDWVRAYQSFGLLSEEVDDA
jgi:predicted ester cyclase